MLLPCRRIKAGFAHAQDDGHRQKKACELGSNEQKTTPAVEELNELLHEVCMSRRGKSFALLPPKIGHLISVKRNLPSLPTARREEAGIIIRAVGTKKRVLIENFYVSITRQLF